MGFRSGTLCNWMGFLSQNLAVSVEYLIHGNVEISGVMKSFILDRKHYVFDRFLYNLLQGNLLFSQCGIAVEKNNGRCCLYFPL